MNANEAVLSVSKMSQTTVSEGETSVSERNSIIGNSGSHNLTGQRARFQPVRIQALLSLFESEDDDTEPRDSDDDSDAESLQALPDDDDDNVNDDDGNKSPQISQEVERSFSPVDSIPMSEKTLQNQVQIESTTSVAAVDDGCVKKSCAVEQGESFDHMARFRSSNNAAPWSLQKAQHTPLIKRLDGGNFTPQAPRSVLEPFKERAHAHGLTSEVKIEPREERAGEGWRNTFETPRNKLKIEDSRSVVETPGIIFSHWSRNNLFQTPNNSSINEHLLKPHRFCNGDKALVRQPLSEAMRLNHVSGGSENRINQPGESETLVKRISQHPGEPESTYNAHINLTAKENCPTDSGRRKTVAQSLHELNKRSLSTPLVKEEKYNGRRSLEVQKGADIVDGEGKKDLMESIFARDNAASNDDKISLRNERENKLSLTQSNSEAALNSRDTNFETLDRGNSVSHKPDEIRANLPLPVSQGKPALVSQDRNCNSNPGNVQFSLATKPGEKKYGKTITVKGNDYLVLGKLGQGMSGEVFRVQEVKSGELYAIKCVDLSCIEKETAQGCLEEVSLLDRLRAPCVINMFSYEIRAHLLYVVLEMGDTDLSKFRQSMSKEKQLPLTMILYCWTEMLTAVKHIHDNGVIHSDLKPSNFLLVRGRLKLIDFGIASTINADMTSVVRNTSVGTLNYMSPEAIMEVGGNGDSPRDDYKYKINFKSDVWSLGCILYSLVYGQTPFQHIRATWAKISAITNPSQKIAFPPAEITTSRGYTSPPPFLIDVMRRCLQHDRRARPTVAQLLQIPYVGCNCPPASSLLSISPTILSKLKQSLEESEWRQLLQALERRNPLQ